MSHRQNDAIVDRLAEYLSANQAIPDAVVQEIREQLRCSPFKYDYFLHEAKTRVETFRKAQASGMNTDEYATYTLEQLGTKMRALMERLDTDYTAEDKRQYDAEMALINMMLQRRWIGY